MDLLRGIMGSSSTVSDSVEEKSNEEGVVGEKELDSEIEATRKLEEHLGTLKTKTDEKLTLATVFADTEVTNSSDDQLKQLKQKENKIEQEVREVQKESEQDEQEEVLNEIGKFKPIILKKAELHIQRGELYDNGININLDEDLDDCWFYLDKEPNSVGAFGVMTDLIVSFMAELRKYRRTKGINIPIPLLFKKYTRYGVSQYQCHTFIMRDKTYEVHNIDVYSQLPKTTMEAIDGQTEIESDQEELIQLIGLNNDEEDEDDEDSDQAEYRKRIKAEWIHTRLGENTRQAESDYVQNLKQQQEQANFIAKIRAEQEESSRLRLVESISDPVALGSEETVYKKGVVALEDGDHVENYRVTITSPTFSNVARQHLQKHMQDVDDEMRTRQVQEIVSMKKEIETILDTRMEELKINGRIEELTRYAMTVVQTSDDQKRIHGVVIFGYKDCMEVVTVFLRRNVLITVEVLSYLSFDSDIDETREESLSVLSESQNAVYVYIRSRVVRFLENYVMLFVNAALHKKKMIKDTEYYRKLMNNYSSAGYLAAFQQMKQKIVESIDSPSLFDNNDALLVGVQVKYLKDILGEEEPDKEMTKVMAGIASRVLCLEKRRAEYEDYLITQYNSVREDHTYGILAKREDTIISLTDENRQLRKTIDDLITERESSDGYPDYATHDREVKTLSLRKNAEELIELVKDTFERVDERMCEAVLHQETKLDELKESLNLVVNKIDGELKDLEDFGPIKDRVSVNTELSIEKSAQEQIRLAVVSAADRNMR